LVGCQFEAAPSFTHCYRCSRVELICGMEIMRKMAAICAILIEASAATVAGAVCGFSCPALVGQVADLSAGHAKALAEICANVGELLDQQPALIARGPVQVDLVQVTRAGMTLRLTQQRGGQTVAGKSLSLSTFDSDQFSPAALRQMADLLIRYGPFSGQPSE